MDAFYTFEHLKRRPNPNILLLYIIDDNTFRYAKSGTSSFQELFIKLGYKSYHHSKGNQYIGKMIETNKKNKNHYYVIF